MVGSELSRVSDQVSEALDESLRRKVNAAADCYNRLPKTIHSNLMVITDFLSQYQPKGEDLHGSWRTAMSLWSCT